MDIPITRNNKAWALSADQLNLFSKTSGASLDAVANQIDSLSGEQVAAITVKQAAGLSPKFVEAFAVGDVASLTDVAVAAIAPEAFASMAVEGLVEANLGLVTSAQINALSENDIYLLSDNNGASNNAESTNDLPFLSIAALAGLDKKNIKYVPMYTLTVEQFSSLKADQLNAYATVQVDNGATNSVDESKVYIGDTNAPELTATQAKGLLPIFTNKLTAGDISKMSDVAVAALAPKAFASLAVKELVESNLGLVTSAQINALTPVQIKSLGDNNGDTADGENDLQFLTKVALVGLDKKNITDLNLTKLTPEQFAGLTADQLNLVATANNVDRVAVDSVQTEGATYQLALLTVNQAKGLTPAFVEALTPEQVGKLTPEAIAALAPKSFVKIDFAGLSADNAGLITSAQINALSADDITALSLTANTIKFIAPAALAGLDKKNIAGLTNLTTTVGDATVQLLTAEQFAALKPAQIQLLSKSAIADLTSEDGIAVLTAPIMATFTPDQIAEIPAESFAKIAPTAIAGLNAKNIVKITDEQLNALTPDQAAFLTPDALKAFKTTMVDSVSETQTVTVGGAAADSGTVAFLGVNTASVADAAAAATVATAIVTAKEAILAGTAAKAAGIIDITVGTGDNDDVLTLTFDSDKGDVGNLAASTTSNGVTFTAGTQVIAGSADLTAAAFANITPAALKNLLPAALTAMAEKTFAGITPEQVAALTPAQTKALTPEQIAKFDAEDAVVLTAAQVGSTVWTAEKATALTSTAIANLTPDAVSKLNIANFDGSNNTQAGTSADISVLTNEQFQKLTATQVATISAENTALILPAQVDGVKTLGSLKLEAIPKLTNDVVEVLDAAHFGRFTTTNLGQLEKFTSEQFTVVSDEVKASLASKNFSTIASGETQTVTLTGDVTVDGAVAFLGVDTESVVEGSDIDTVGAAIVAAKANIIAGNIAKTAGVTDISYDATTDKLTLTFENAKGDVANLAASSVDNGITFSTGTEVPNQAQAIETSLIVDVSTGTGATIVVGKKEATVIGSDHKDHITGGNGVDIIGGGAGNDTILGGAAADVITGGLGDDELTGDAGADTFDFSTNGSVSGTDTDTILDYTSGSDIIKFGAATIAKATVDNSGLVASSGSGNVQVNTGGVVTFHATDISLVERVSAIQEDVELNAAGQVALFTSGADSYLYYSGLLGTADDAGNADDQIIKLKDLDATGLIITDSNKITSVSFVPDVTPPVAVASIVSLSADTGTSNTDFITKTAAQTISGTYEGVIASGETLKVSLDDGATWVAATTATGGNWTLTSQTITSNQIQAAVFDAAGNYSEAALQVVALDEEAPSSLAAIGLTATSPTNDTTPTITVALLADVVMDAGDIIKIFDTSNSDAVVGSYTVVAGDLTTCAWNGTTKAITTSALTAGTHALKVGLVDLAGNIGTLATVASVAIDTTAPTASALTVTATTVGFTSTEAGTNGLQLVKASDGTALSTPIQATLTAATPQTVTVAVQSPAIATTLKVFDNAGNAADLTQSVILGLATADSTGLDGTSGADIVFGFGGNDTINLATLGGNDIVIGGAGADNITLGSGLDKVILAAADTSLTVILGTTASANSALTGFDVVTGLARSNGTILSETLDVPGTAALYAPSGTVNIATTVDLTAYHGTAGDASTKFASLVVASGIATFHNNDTPGSTTAITLSDSNIAGAVSALQGIDIGSIGTTVAFAVGSDLYVFTQGTDDGTTEASDTLVKLVGQSTVDALIITNTAGANDLFIA